MNKSKKKIFLIISIAIFLSGAVFAGLQIHRHVERERAMEQERQIAEAYFRVNLLRYAPEGRSPSRGEDEVYRSFEEYRVFGINEWGICAATYLFLKFYEHETGVAITYETLMDYFSEEFEPDGSRRLYNNGKHPEIQALVEWTWVRRSWSEFGVYLYRIGNILEAYRTTSEDLNLRGISEFSPQMLDAAARAAADPNYVLDLTSLQRAGY